MGINAEERGRLIDALQQSLEAELFTRHGPIMTGEALLQALGYPSHEAFRQSLSRDKTSVQIFTIEHRKGKFALVKDVARHLAEQRYNSMFSQIKEGGELCNIAN